MAALRQHTNPKACSQPKPNDFMLWAWVWCPGAELNQRHRHRDECVRTPRAQFTP